MSVMEKKMLVDIINEAGIKSSKKYPVIGNTVVIRRSKNAPGGIAYKAEFDKDALLPYWSGIFPFKRLKQKLILIEGTTRCISFRFQEDKAKVDMPFFDKEAAEELFKAHVIKAAGATVSKINVPTLLYILVFANVVIGIITLLLSSGRVRIG